MGGNGADSAWRLAEIVAARICHDLSGPLSIVSSAGELARLESERGMRPDGEAMALMLEGGEAIGSRVKLLRALFGTPSGALSADDLATLARGQVGGGRAEVDVTGLAPGTVFGPEAARALLAALVVSGEALPRGGTIRVHGIAEDVSIAIEGMSAAWPPSLTAVLGGEDPVATALAGGPRALMGPMLVMQAREAGFAPALLMGAGPPLLRLARAAA